MLMTLLSLQIRLKICNSNWTNSMTIHVSKGSSWTLTKQKSWSSSARILLRFPPAIPTITYDGTPLELVTEFKHLGITLTRDGSMLTAARRWQTTSGLPLPEFIKLVIARVSSTENLQCYGFSRSLLWQLVCTVVKYGPLLLWHCYLKNHPRTCPSPLGFLKNRASWLDSWRPL